MLPKIRMGTNERTEDLVLPYGYIGATLSLHGLAMNRRRGRVRSAVRSRPCRHLTRAVLPGALQHAGAATYVRGDVLDLRRRPAERGSA